MPSFKLEVPVINQFHIRGDIYQKEGTKEVSAHYHPLKTIALIRCLFVPFTRAIGFSSLAFTPLLYKSFKMTPISLDCQWHPQSTLCFNVLGIMSQSLFRYWMSIVAISGASFGLFEALLFDIRHYWEYHFPETALKHIGISTFKKNEIASYPIFKKMPHSILNIYHKMNRALNFTMIGTTGFQLLGMLIGFPIAQSQSYFYATRTKNCDSFDADFCPQKIMDEAEQVWNTWMFAMLFSFYATGLLLGLLLGLKPLISKNCCNFSFFATAKRDDMKRPLLKNPIN